MKTVLWLFKRLFCAKNPAETAEQVSAPVNVPPPPSRPPPTPSPLPLQIGRLDSRCPYCEAELQKRPKAKTRCKTCGNFIRVRWDANGCSTLLREDQLSAFDEQKFNSPEYAKFREAVEEVTIIPFADDREWIKEPMLAKARQFAEWYADIADKPAFAALVTEHFGARYESLVDSVALRFNLQRSRATLILRHAGNVLSEYYRQRRAQRAGSKKYTWCARHDDRVCRRCRELDGKVIFWDDPPEGGNPGECECWRFTSPDYAKVAMGRLDSRCPNCEAELVERPRGRSKCKRCKEWIWVKTNAEGQSVLLSEEMLADFDRQENGPETCRCFSIPIIELPQLKP